MNSTPCTAAASPLSTFLESVPVSCSSEASPAAHREVLAGTMGFLGLTLNGPRWHEYFQRISRVAFKENQEWTHAMEIKPGFPVLRTASDYESGPSEGSKIGTCF